MNRSRVGVALVGALLAIGAGWTAPAPERIRDDIARLTEEDWQGRRAGTPGAEGASAWIAERFRAIGLEPLGEDGTYFQPFTFRDGVILGSDNRLTTGRPARAWKLDADYRPLAFSAAGEAAGEVVFAGYGIVAPDLGRDDYAGVDVRDRVVLVLRYGPDGNDPGSRWMRHTALRRKALVVKEKGARALLIVTGPRTADGDAGLASPRIDASASDVGIPVLTVTRPVAEHLFRGADRTLAEAQDRADTGPASFTLAAWAAVRADLSPRRSRTRNVVGVQRARERAERPQFLVVGAHYDHLGTGAAGSLDPAPDGKIHHGADDNASGVAAVLELARRLAPRRAELRRDIVFVAFGAEELGTLGSAHFVREPPVTFDSIVAMVNLDMVGRLRDVLEVHGVGTSPVWKPLLAEANRAAGLELRFREGGYGPSDHTPFYAAGKPVLFLFTGVHPDYHRPSDTVEKIDAAGIDRIVSLLEPVALGLAAGRDAVAFTRVPDERVPSAGGRGLRVWMGGVPDYGAEERGVRFSGVSAGSPAEKAGLKGGDVLVRLAGREVRGIEDLMDVLSSHASGDTITAVVRRDGREFELPITLAARPASGQ